MRSILAVAAAAFAAVVVATAGTMAWASRNSSGTMSAANGPYVGGTTINVSQVNSRFADIESEITDSLSRSGKGSMTAALKVADGTVALPGVSFSSETATGLYRVGANNPALAVNGSKRQDWTTTGTVVTGTLASTSDFAVNTNKFTVTATSGNTAVAGTLGITGATTLTGGVTGALAVDAAGGNGVSSLTYGLKFGGTSSTEGISSNRSGSGANTNGLDFLTNNSVRMLITSAGAVTTSGALTASGGFQVGTSGTQSAQVNAGSCTLNGGTPASCTATVASGVKCVSSIVGAANTSGVSLSGTTLTVWGPNASVSTVNYFCW